MKLWKILLIPYVPILAWIIFSLLVVFNIGIVGAFIGAVFLLYGILALVAYSGLFGTIMLVRYLLKKRKKG